MNQKLYKYMFKSVQFFCKKVPPVNSTGTLELF